MLKMLEKWKSLVDKGRVIGSLLTDLSRAIECLDHELLIAKLNTYDFSLPVLRLIHDYFSNRKQRIRSGNWYSIWFEINPFSTNVSLLYKPSSWFFLAKCLKNTCGRVAF